MVNRKLWPGSGFATALGHAQAGRLADSVTFYHGAVALHPGYAEAHQKLGSALSDRGEVDAAIASFQKALGLRPDYAMAQGTRRLVIGQVPPQLRNSQVA